MIDKKFNNVEGLVFLQFIVIDINDSLFDIQRFIIGDKFNLL